MGRAPFVKGFHGVRYQVADVPSSVAFYTEQLGFDVKHQQPPAFASVALGDLHVLLSGPGAFGSRSMPDGRPQRPGGWNRIVLRVEDLPAVIDSLRSAGHRFRNEMETGGRQADPDRGPGREPDRAVRARSVGGPTFVALARPAVRPLRYDTFAGAPSPACSKTRSATATLLRGALRWIP